MRKKKHFTKKYTYMTVNPFFFGKMRERKSLFRIILKEWNEEHIDDNSI